MNCVPCKTTPVRRVCVFAGCNRPATTLVLPGKYAIIVNPPLGRKLKEVRIDCCSEHRDFMLGFWKEAYVERLKPWNRIGGFLCRVKNTLC